MVASYSQFGLSDREVYLTYLKTFRDVFHGVKGSGCVAFVGERGACLLEQRSEAEVGERAGKCEEDASERCRWLVCGGCTEFFPKIGCCEARSDGSKRGRTTSGSVGDETACGVGTSAGSVGGAGECRHGLCGSVDSSGNGEGALSREKSKGKEEKKEVVRGSNWEKNCERRAKKKARKARARFCQTSVEGKKVETVVSETLVEKVPVWRRKEVPVAGSEKVLGWRRGSGEITVAEREAKETLALRRTAENKVAAAKAEFQLKLFGNKNFNEIGRKMREAQALEKVARARAGTEKNLSDCSSIDPDSSISLQGLKQQAERLRLVSEKEKDLRAVYRRWEMTGVVQMDDVDKIDKKYAEMEVKFEFADGEYEEIEDYEDMGRLDDVDEMKKLKKAREELAMGVKVLNVSEYL